MRSPLAPDTLLELELCATCARNQYTCDPGPVITELAAAARGRDYVLAQTPASVDEAFRDRAPLEYL